MCSPKTHKHTYEYANTHCRHQKDLPYIIYICLKCQDLPS